jgi:hypothetical protein
VLNFKAGDGEDGNDVLVSIFVVVAVSSLLSLTLLEIRLTTGL